MERPCNNKFHVIDRSQVDTNQETLVVSCCDDCACPTSPFGICQTSSQAQYNASDFLVRAANLHFEALDDGYWAVFNPNGNSGIIVLNESSRSLLDTFSTPLQITDMKLQHEDESALDAPLARLLSLELLHPVGYPSKPIFIVEDELVVWLHVTNNCNLACSYCYLSQSNEHMPVSTGFAAVDAVIHSARESGFRKIRLKYAGGEASLVIPSVYAIHDYAIERCEVSNLELRAVLLTNGIGLLNRDLTGLRDRNIRVMVSLDGLGSTHDYQRPLHSGKPTAKKVLEAINSLQQADVDIHLSVTVTSQNCGSLNEIVRYALERDLSFSFNLYRDTEDSAANRDLQCTTDCAIAGLENAFKVAYEYTPRRTLMGTLLDRGNLLAPHTNACGVGRNYLVIDHHGSISKCHMLMRAIIADVSCDHLIHMMRQSECDPHNPPVTLKPKCMTCNWRYYCAGGCPLGAYRATGRYEAHSPYCEVYKALYPMAVRLEGLRLLKYGPQYEGY